MTNEREFDIQVNITAKLTVKNEVIDRVLNNEDNWKEIFYDLDLTELIEMIACNMIRGSPVDTLNGFADLSYDCANLSDVNCNLEYFKELSK